MGRFFLPTGPENCAVGVSDGRILKIGKQLEADYTLDFGHFLVLPGAVDTHVHFRDPGKTQKEDVKTGSTAAVFGGVTTFMDMPNTVPPVRTHANLEAKRLALRDRSLVDYGLYCEAHPSTDFEAAAQLALGFKLYLAPTTGVEGYESMQEAHGAVTRAVASGRPITVHAEDPALIDRSARPATLTDWAKARPPAAEASAIQWLAENFDTRKMTIAHLSSREGLEAAEKSGYAGTLETSPHHAILDTDVKGLARPSMAKTNPPVRPKQDQEAIFAGLRAGKIQYMASDHAPHTPEEKGGDFAEAPSGVPGVETMLPMLMARVFYRQIDLARVVEACCGGPAARFGLPKGKIAVGYDADFAVFDPRDVKRVRPEALHSKCGWTPFEGQFAVMPAAVFLRGDELMAEGTIRTARPPGQLLRPGIGPGTPLAADVAEESYGDASEE